MSLGENKTKTDSGHFAKLMALIPQTIALAYSIILERSN